MSKCSIYDDGNCKDECSYCVITDCEKGTDADFDRYAVDVQNGNGYYDSCGNYVSYGNED